MRRLLGTVILLGALGAFVFLALGAGGGGNGDPSYWVELDNAFGLIKGGDAKIAGVRAGKIGDLKLADAKRLGKNVNSVSKDCQNKLKPGGGTPCALVQIHITATGWGSLRTDVQCETRPQSLIGEYFIDCLPGVASQQLKAGTPGVRTFEGDPVVPLAQTSSTISPDLVNDVMREPYKERFRIILNELGATAGGNAANLNQALRRAVPALRETDQVLAILARQNQILADLAVKGDRVITDLANNRSDVQRWVVSAKNAAQVSATRQADISAGIRNLPGFLEELRPAMVQLGNVADQQTPALRNLNASAHQLDVLARLIKPFSEASLPAIQAFGKAAQTGRAAVKAATPTIQQLNAFAQGAPELGQNLAIVLEHLDNRQFAVEKDPRSPGGQGFTGLESLLNYVFWQSTAINLFDATDHLLNTANFFPLGETNCGTITDAATVKSTPGLMAKCGDYLGPTQPGLTTPDPTAAQGGPTSVRAQRRAAQRAAGGAGPNAQNGGGGGSGGGGGGGASGVVQQLHLPSLGNILPGGAAPGTGVTGLPGLPAVNVPSVPGVHGPPVKVPTGATGGGGPGAGHLLDYLLGP